VIEDVATESAENVHKLYDKAFPERRVYSSRWRHEQVVS